MSHDSFFLSFLFFASPHFLSQPSRRSIRGPTWPAPRGLPRAGCPSCRGRGDRRRLRSRTVLRPMRPGALPPRSSSGRIPRTKTGSKGSWPWLGMRSSSSLVPLLSPPQQYGSQGGGGWNQQQQWQNPQQQNWQQQQQGYEFPFRFSTRASLTLLSRPQYGTQGGYQQQQQQWQPNQGQNWNQPSGQGQSGPSGPPQSPPPGQGPPSQHGSGGPPSNGGQVPSGGPPSGPPPQQGFGLRTRLCTV